MVLFQQTDSTCILRAEVMDIGTKAFMRNSNRVRIKKDINWSEYNNKADNLYKLLGNLNIFSRRSPPLRQTEWFLFSLGLLRIAEKHKDSSHAEPSDVKCVCSKRIFFIWAVICLKANRSLPSCGYQECVRENCRVHQPDDWSWTSNSVFVICKWYTQQNIPSVILPTTGRLKFDLLLTERVAREVTG